MPRKSKPGSTYPPGWPEFARKLKDEAGWACTRCGRPHDPPAGYCLTVHHLTMAKDEPFEHWWAFAVLCQRCHLSVQARVDLDRPWVLLPHSEWFKIHAGGWYAFKYLGQSLTREEVAARLDELLGLERRAVLGVAV
jgi:hypothetical protein